MFLFLLLNLIIRTSITLSINLQIFLNIIQYLKNIHVVFI